MRRWLRAAVRASRVRRRVWRRLSVRRGVEADLPVVDETARRLIGGSFSPVPRLRERLSVDPTMLRVVERIDSGKHVAGFTVVYRLTRAATELILDGRIAEGPQLELSHFVGGRVQPASIYIARVVGDSLFSRAVVIWSLAEAIRRELRKNPRLEVFARPGTAPGQQQLARHGFAPLSSQEGIWRLSVDSPYRSRSSSRRGAAREFLTRLPRRRTGR